MRRSCAVDAAVDVRLWVLRCAEINASGLWITIRILLPALDLDFGVVVVCEEGEELTDSATSATHSKRPRRSRGRRYKTVSNGEGDAEFEDDDGSTRSAAREIGDSGDALRFMFILVLGGVTRYVVGGSVVRPSSVSCSRDGRDLRCETTNAFATYSKPTCIHTYRQ